MEYNFRLTRYLQVILAEYLNDRYLTYETNDGTRRRELTAGATEGSILGPDVWKIFYHIY